MRPPVRCVGLIQYFYGIRNSTGVTDNPITMSVIQDWQSHIGIRLEKWERDCIFAMDRAFRQSYAEVLKYHANRDEEKRKNSERRSRSNG